MPPKVKITRQDIVQAAVQLLQSGGEQAISARAIATALGCSTQPIFSNFSTVDELRLAVVQHIDGLYEDYIRRETQTGEFPPYKAGGMGYIRFAKEQKKLFKFLFMRDRTEENFPQDCRSSDEMIELLRQSAHLDGDRARLFHLEMWAFVHGIASMLSTGFLDLDRELISSMLSDAYFGLRKRFGME